MSLSETLANINRDITMDTEIYAYIAESAKMTSADLSELHNFAIYYGDDVILNLKITLRYFLINNILYSEDKQS